MKKSKIIFSTLILSLTLSSCDYDLFNFNDLSNQETGTKLTNKYLLKTITDKQGTLSLNSTGEAKILVIPVSFSDFEEYSTSENIQAINRAFFGDSNDTSYESVKSYYYKSSNGVLNISGKVAPSWFDANMTTSQLSNYTKDESGEAGTCYLLDQAVSWYKSNYDDISDFDNDNNGNIDAVWLVYNAPNYSNSNAVPNDFWAFTYWNTDNVGVQNTAVLYSFASIDFMLEDGSTEKPDARTYIHETGHMFGLIDYYSGSDKRGPFGFVDMMDFNIGDHCAYSKYSLGWITPTYANKSGVYTLTTAQNGSSCLIIKNSNFNYTPYDEYFMVELISPTDLNYQDSQNRYTNGLKWYQKTGIRISHVDSRGYKLTSSTYGGYDVYETDNYSAMNALLSDNFYEDAYEFLIDSNTNEPYLRQTIMQKNATKDLNVLKENFMSNLPSNLDSYITNFLYFEGDTFTIEDYYYLIPSNTYEYNDGTTISRNSYIKVSSLDSDSATITIKY